MAQEKEYFAFISYQRKDEEWADRLRSKLEHYRLPSSVRKQDASLPKEIRPIFRDALELAGGVLAKEIEKALQQSKFLIVICSPNSAKSPWVNKEIQTFIDLGREDHIIPFIIDGTPFSENDSTECFPPALRSLQGEKELLGININELGRDAAAIKVVARMFGLKFDTLWQRYEREKKRKRWMIIGGALLFGLVSLGIGAYIARQNQELDARNREVVAERDRANSERERAESANESLLLANDSIKRQYTLIEQQKNEIATERDNVKSANYAMKVNLSRILAKEASKLVDEGDSYLARLIALQALPPNLPYTTEAEIALRRAYVFNDAILKGHTGYKIYVSLSPDGNRIISCSDDYIDRTLRFWDVETGQNIMTLGKTSHDYLLTKEKVLKDLLGHNNNTIMAEISQDGKTLIVANSNRTAQIWSLDSKMCISEINHSKYIYSVALNSNGSRAITGGEIIKIWDTKSGQCLQEIPLSTSTAISMTISPDDKYLAAGLSNNEVCVWDTELCTFIDEFNGHTGNVTSLVFSPDNKRLITASRDHTIRIWELQLRKRSNMVLDDYDNKLICAIFNRDDKNVISFSDNIARIWRIDNGECIDSITFDSNITYLWDTKNDTFLLHKSRTMKSTNMSSALELHGDVVPIRTKQGIDIYNVRNETLLNSIQSPSECHVYTMAISPNDKMLALSTCNHDVILWDISANKKLDTIIKHAEEVRGLVFSPNANLLASASEDGTIYLWNLKNKNGSKILKGHDEGVLTLAFSKDGKALVSGSRDNTIRVWDVATGLCKRVLYGHTAAVNSVAFSHDGKKIVSTSFDGSLRIWDFPPLQEIIDETRKRFKNRPLTREERRKYYLE